jgi:WD40-like Beta Propeller Repeat
MKLRSMFLLACVFLLANCSATPTPQPTAVATTAPTATATSTPSPAPSATANAFGLNIVAAFDPTRRVLTIYGITPGATIVMGGTPLLPPPPPPATDTPTLTSASAPTDTNTPAPTSTPPPRVVVPQPTRTPAVQVSAAALHGKIIFKSARDGGAYPSSFAYYVMNPDGSNVQKLDFNATNSLYISLQGLEGFSPDRGRVVLGERRCYGGGYTCALYILDTQLDAALINSNDDISHGQWFSNKGFQAKDPVWSPAGNYIAFASNHEQPQGQGCIRTQNIFKGTPTQNPTIRRLTTFCAGSNGGHPSFSPDGAQLTFWDEDSGMKQIYLLDVGADDTWDYRFANPRIIDDHQSDDWDPLWVK